MEVAIKIKQILLKRNLTIKQLTAMLNQKPSYLYNRFKYDKFTEKELEAIAEALDCDFECVFTLRDTGEKI